eukprot:403361204
MSSDVNEEIEDELTCTICLDLLYQPVSTQCGHTFCKTCLSNSLKYKNQCTICREPILLSSDLLPVNIVLQKLIEKKYPKIVKKIEEAAASKRLEQTQQEQQALPCDNIPIWIDGTHILPGTNTMLTITGRAGLDMTHLILRGNRRFVIMKSEQEMRGFVLVLKKVTPTLVRSQVIAEVQGVERFIADQIFIPEERQNLYLDEAQALKFARGRIIKDLPTRDQFHNAIEERQNENGLLEKCQTMQRLFETEFDRRSQPDQISLLRGTFGEYPTSQSGTVIQRVERQTLYVLSHLELQNQHKELIFTSDPQERINAIINDLQNVRMHHKLFVWEADIPDRVKESNKSLMLILGLFLLFFLARFFR